MRSLSTLPSHAPQMRVSFYPAVLAVAVLLPGCATAPLVQGGSLSSYEGLAPSDGMVTKSKLLVRKEQVLAAKTVRILPTQFQPFTAPTMTVGQRELVATVVSRALCVSLSDRFNVVAPDAAADLTVHATVTQATPTNEVAAGLSVAASLGSSFIDTSVPIPVPRIPFGLGNLSIEAEAVDLTGQQQAAMLWGRGATAVFSSPKMSKAGDAYDLAVAFGEDFAELMARGETPYKFHGVSLPSWDRMMSKVGLAPKYKACEVYGRSPGLVGLVGGKVGLPPEWTDGGAKKPKPAN